MIGRVIRATQVISHRVLRTAERLTRGARRAAFDLAPPASPTPRLHVWSPRQGAAVPLPDAGGVTRHDAPPLILVMSVVTTSLVFDLQANNSLVRRFLDEGYDVYLLDWGVPDAVDSANTLQTYCDEHLPRAVQATLRESGAEEVALFGYPLGAVLAMLSLAGHARMPVRAMILLATPLDMSELGPLTSMLRDRRLTVDDLLDWSGNVPPERIKQSFQLVEPAGEITTYLSLWNSLGDPERLQAHDALVRWSSGHIPFPGAAFREMTDLCIHQDALVQGRVPIGRQIVDLADIRIPVLSVTGAKDKLVPAASSAPLALPNADLERLELNAGHAGLIVGRRAHKEMIPAMLEWLREHA